MKELLNGTQIENKIIFRDASGMTHQFESLKEFSEWYILDRPRDYFSELCFTLEIPLIEGQYPTLSATQRYNLFIYVLDQMFTDHQSLGVAMDSYEGDFMQKLSQVIMKYLEDNEVGDINFIKDSIKYIIEGTRHEDT